MKMDAGLDTGAILTQRALRLTRDDTAGSVTGTLSTLGADLLLATLPDYLAGNLIPQPQDKSLATYAPMLKKEDGRLTSTVPRKNWNAACGRYSPGLARSSNITASRSKS